MSVTRIIRAGFLFVLAASVLAACGRAGAPLKPSEAAIERAKENNETPPPAPVPNKNNPDKRFILDGLLE